MAIDDWFFADAEDSDAGSFLDFGGGGGGGFSFDFGLGDLFGGGSDALDLDWASDIVSSGKGIFPDDTIDLITSNFNISDLFGNIGTDVGDWFGDVSTNVGNWFGDIGKDVGGWFDFGGYSSDVVNDLDAIKYADMEDMDAGQYLDDQYIADAADVLEGIDRSDLDAELFREQAVISALKDQMDIADQQDMDAARYLDELQGMDTTGFEFADQEDIDRELYRTEQLDPLLEFADQEDLDREMYRKEQEDMGITREGAASGKFTDLSGGGGKGGTDTITKKEITTKDTSGGGGGGGGKISDLLKNQDNQLLLALLGGLLGLLGRNSGGQPQAGYQGGIPKYIATRGTPTAPTAGGRRAGGAGIGSLTGGVTYTKAAQGGLMELAEGGEVKDSAIDLPSWTPTSDISAKWTSTPDPSAGSFVTPGGRALGYTPTADELSRAQSLRDQYGFGSRHGGDAAMRDALNLARRQAAGTMSDEDVRNTALAYKYNYSPADVGKILARGGTEQDVQYNALARFYGDTPDTIERYGVDKDLPMKLAMDEAKRRGIPVEQIASNYVDLNYINPEWAQAPKKNLISYIETEDGLQQVVKENPEYAVYLLKKMLEKQQEAGQQGAGSSVLPQYTAERTPGAGVTYTRAAQGGLMGLAQGSQGKYLRGATDGMADKIPASIEGKQPALLSHGEYVIPADVVSHLGNGNSDAGAKRLEEMSKKVRTARTGNPKQGKQINPRKYLPA